MARAGVAVLTLNSRGHDVVSRTTHASGPRIGGLAFEDLDDAPLDLRAGARLLAERGCTRVALAGHSLGAVKAVLTQASDGTNAACVIALSPPRFCHQTQLRAETGARFRETLEEARALVAAGRGDALMRVEAPIPAYFAAAQYLKKYGPEDRYDFARQLDAVRCPVLLLYGGEEKGLLAAIGSEGDEPRAIEPREGLTFVTIDGGDHVYTGRVEQVVEALRRWLRSEDIYTAPGAVGASTA
jgi:pimeloyl-ACP methyl ester carboxylesterase